MSGKKQFKTYLPEEKIEQIRGMEESNTDIVDQGVEMFLRARGMMDAASLEDEIRNIDREMQRVRREANEDLAKLSEKRDKLVETLEWREQQDDLVEMTIGEIAEGLHDNSNQNLHAYGEQVEFLVAHSNGPHDRQEIQAKVQEYARKNDLSVGVMQLYPDRFDSAGVRASTDGGEDDGTTVDTSRYQFEDDDE